MFTVGRHRGKIIQRAPKINASTKSLVERWCDLKIYAVSVLGCVGSISAPDEATLNDEAHALQCTTAGPYNAIPTSLLCAGSVCGLGPDLLGIHTLSLAARLEAFNIVRCLDHSGKLLHKTTTKGSHSLASRQITGAGLCQADAVHTSRILGPVSRFRIAHMKLASRASRPGLTVGFLRILCNGLCTARSFHVEGEAQMCRIGCPDEPDSLSHDGRGHLFHDSPRFFYEASRMESW